MHTYDFHALNDKEFEALVTDLLSVHEGHRFERFKPGRDSGVDGRWFASKDREEVIQCKHWSRSSYAALFRHLVSGELPKIAKLQPSRYILATSLELSRANKREIAVALGPYIASEADVLGLEDLNDILARHEDVERRHFKLWLSSSAALINLLSNAIIGRSRFELQQMREEARLYAATHDYTKALDHLGEHHVLLLTGEPGIGKTTLAKQLVLEHVADGFQFIAIEESISEAEAIYAEDARQIFYFDDFLGRTFLEALKQKQDSHILGFANRVARGKGKRLILTSRTNILNQGMALTDRFAFDSIERNRYELRVGQLAPLDRARILYNHIWHGELPPEYVDEIYRNRRYREIIAHQNFNPRLVAFVVDHEKVANVPASEYWSYITTTLSNPAAVWDHFFSSQLSQHDRDLTFLTVLNGRAIREDVLEKAFMTLHNAHAGDRGQLQHDFRLATRHCVGSVLDRRLLPNDSASYSLFNPSIADFAHAYLGRSELWEYYFASLRTITALSYLRQMGKQPYFGLDLHRRVVRSLIAGEAARGAAHDEYGMQLARMVADDDALRSEHPEVLTQWLTDAQAVPDDRAGDFIAVLIGSASAVDRDVRRSAARDLPALLDRAYVPLDEPEVLAGMFEELRALEEYEVADELRSVVIDEWTENLPRAVKEAGTLDGFYDEENYSEAADVLDDAIRDWLGSAGVDLTTGELRQLRNEVDIHSAIEENRASYRDEDDEYVGGGFSAGGGDIDDLFDRSAAPQR